MITFNINIEFDTSLTIKQIWPDGDAPENPTIEDVKKEICKDLKLRSHDDDLQELINKWGLDEDGIIRINKFGPTESKENKELRLKAEEFADIMKG